MGDYLLKTTDGGETWSNQFHSADITSVFFVNDKTGYLVAGRDAGKPNIFKTRTGGE